MAFKYAPGTDHPFSGLWSFVGDVVRRTDNAIRFKPSGWQHPIWLPRGAIKEAATATGCEICMPEWLAKRKGLIG